MLPSPPYPCGAWHFRNPQTGEIAPYRCGAWHCPDCAARLADRWAAVINYAAPQRHIVITALDLDPAAARGCLRNIVKAIRRGQAHGSGSRKEHIDFRYFAAFETNRAGTQIHAHLLQHGDSIPQRRLSQMLPAYGAGSICWLKSFAAAARPIAVARYVARHLVGYHHADQVKAGRRVRYSRDFFRGQTTAEIRSILWPPEDPDATWELVRPGLELEALRRAEDRAHVRSIRTDEILAAAVRAGATEADLTRRRLIRPYIPPLEDLGDD